MDIPNRDCDFMIGRPTVHYKSRSVGRRRCLMISLVDQAVCCTCRVICQDQPDASRAPLNMLFGPNMVATPIRTRCMRPVSVWMSAIAGMSNMVRDWVDVFIDAVGRETLSSSDECSMSVYMNWRISTRTLACLKMQLHALKR